MVDIFMEKRKHFQFVKAFKNLVSFQKGPVKCKLMFLFIMSTFEYIYLSVSKYL